MTDRCGISRKIALRWTLLDLSNDKSTLVQVMAWCRQATSHYLNLSQCWPRSQSPYGGTRPQWVKGIIFNCIVVFSRISNGIALRWLAQGPIVNIGSGNRLVPAWHQAITWVNVDLSPWRFMALPGHNEFMLADSLFRWSIVLAH